MCSPMALGVTSLVIGTMSSIGQGIAAQQQANAQAAYQDAQANEYARVANLNNIAAGREYAEQTTAERIAQMQEQDKSSKEIQEVQRDMLRKQGTMLASTNASGLALDALMADYQRESAMNKDTIRHQYEMNTVGHELSMGAMKDKAYNRINSQQRYIKNDGGYSKGLNILNTALGIGGAAVGAYGVYDHYKQQEPTAITKTGLSSYGQKKNAFLSGR